MDLKRWLRRALRSVLEYSVSPKSFKLNQMCFWRDRNYDCHKSFWKQILTRVLWTHLEPINIDLLKSNGINLGFIDSFSGSATGGTEFQMILIVNQRFLVSLDSEQNITITWISSQVHQYWIHSLAFISSLYHEIRYWL